MFLCQSHVRKFHAVKGSVCCDVGTTTFFECLSVYSNERMVKVFSVAQDGKYEQLQCHVQNKSHLIISGSPTVDSGGM